MSCAEIRLVFDLYTSIYDRWNKDCMMVSSSLWLERGGVLAKLLQHLGRVVNKPSLFHNESVCFNDVCFNDVILVSSKKNDVILVSKCPRTQRMLACKIFGLKGIENQ